MAAVDQAKAILENLAGKTLTNSVSLNVVENFINYRNSQGLTGEQKAQKFVDELFLAVKRQVRTGAMQEAQEDNLSVVTAAGNSSVSEL